MRNANIFMVSVCDGVRFEIHHNETRKFCRRFPGVHFFSGNVLSTCNVDDCLCVIFPLCKYNGEGNGLQIRHALSGRLLRSLPFNGDIICVCVNDPGTLVVFATDEGLLLHEVTVGLTSALGLAVCWDQRSGQTTEHQHSDTAICAICFVEDDIVIASDGTHPTWRLRLPTCLKRRSFIRTQFSPFCYS